MDFLKEYFEIQENIKNIKIYSSSNEIFDSEKYDITFLKTLDLSVEGLK